MLNLKDNDLGSGADLLEYSQANFWIEDIRLDGNLRLSYQLVEQVGTECRQNLLIRE